MASPDPLTGPPLVPAAHTDQCIRDAARYGFCDHTRLYAASLRPRHLDPRRRERARGVLAWVAIAALVGSTYLLATRVSLLITLAVTALSGLGWLLVFTCGLPRPLTSDPAQWLPADKAAHARRDITGSP